MVVDKAGYRLNVGIIIASENGEVFWGRRVGQHAWQFPQGGVGPNESAQEAMFRELKEEVGLDKPDVEILAVTKHWLKYRLPKQFIRQGNKPTVIGQKQKWFLMRLLCPEQKIKLDLSHTPEFDSWRWVDFNLPAEQVIYFKRQVYRQALKELSPYLDKENAAKRFQSKRHRRGNRKVKS
jgi:putative (di)nucleoside polyphosphate hydrolase